MTSYRYRRRTRKIENLDHEIECLESKFLVLLNARIAQCNETLILMIEHAKNPEYRDDIKKDAKELIGQLNNILSGCDISKEPYRYLISIKKEFVKLLESLMSTNIRSDRS